MQWILLLFTFSSFWTCGCLVLRVCTMSFHKWQLRSYLVSLIFNVFTLKSSVYSLRNLDILVLYCLQTSSLVTLSSYFPQCTYILLPPGQSWKKLFTFIPCNSSFKMLLGLHLYLGSAFTLRCSLHTDYQEIHTW